MISRDHNIDKHHLQQLLDVAQTAVIEAGKKVMDIYQSTATIINKRSNDNPLTAADLASNETISKILADTGIPLLSEESSAVPYDQRTHWEQLWVVDPLDGTKEFIARNDEFTINIALVVRGYPILGVVYVPAQNSLYYGSMNAGCGKIVDGINTSFSITSAVTMDDLLLRDHVNIAISRSHTSPETLDFLKQFNSYHAIVKGSAIKFMMLLEGTADIYPRLAPTMEWDTAAAHAILNSANKGIYQLDLFSQLAYNKSDLSNPPFLAF